ncbi:conserved hypothetical protein [Vibrio chagasii]|nr:conserved hypothetical protein [Vibrio chagasii]CAH7371122.1 conserved hypothetical protein [Vibrio chagasii]
MNLACSYNHHFSTGKLYPSNDVRLIELGFKAYQSLFVNNLPSNKISSTPLSLHISRSPITEPEIYQDQFINEKLIDKKDDNRIISLGFHLCGDRNTNIGKLGFSSHYKHNDDSESNAIRFLTKVQQVTKKPVWLENANFYSSSVNEIISNWKSFNRVVKASGAGAIIDLSHLIIDCSNNNISPLSMIGFIDWNSVVEIHLSGIIEGKDGALHDGHGTQVHSSVWELLQQLLKLELLDKNAFINIEHSDDVWSNKTELYNRDFDILKKLLNEPIKQSSKAEHAQMYAQSYLRKILTQEVENIEEISEFFNITPSDLLNEWMEYVINVDKRIALSIDDMDSLIEKNSIHFIQSFTEFVDYKQQ